MTGLPQYRIKEEAWQRNFPGTPNPSPQTLLSELRHPPFYASRIVLSFPAHWWEADDLELASTESAKDLKENA